MMPTLHLVALGLYGLAAALALAPFAGLPSLSRRWSVALPAAGALAHGVALAQLNPAGLAPILSLLALFLIVLQLCCELLLRATAVALFTAPLAAGLDRKSTRLNSSHSQISYAVFCLKKKKKH